MIISILTLFPEMFSGPFDFSIIKKAIDKKILKINLINIRDFAEDKYRTVDDSPFGGGVGMIMKVDIIDRCLEFAKKQYPKLTTKVILTDPKGKTYNQKIAQIYAEFEHLIIICGHYEGVDARVNFLIDEAVSIGNFITTGGELPSLLIVDSIGRLLKGVLKPNATKIETFNDSSFEAPQYTRPQVYKKWKVPEILLSGHHKNIVDWKKKNTKKITD